MLSTSASHMSKQVDHPSLPDQLATFLIRRAQYGELNQINSAKKEFNARISMKMS